MKPCSYCQQHQRSCRVDIRSGRCAECVRRGRACNVRTTKAEFDKLVAARATLKEQVAVAAKAKSDALEAFLSAQAKEDRLRKQLELTEKRGQVAFEEELAEVDELDPPIPLDLPVDDFLWDDRLALSPSAWAGFTDSPLDLVVGNPGAPSSSS